MAVAALGELERLAQHAPLGAFSAGGQTQFVQVSAQLTPVGPSRRWASRVICADVSVGGVGTS